MDIELQGLAQVQRVGLELANHLVVPQLQLNIVIDPGGTTESLGIQNEDNARCLNPSPGSLLS